MKKKTARKTVLKKKASRKALKKNTAKKSTVKKSPRLRKILSSDEPKPFRVENPRGQGAGLILCDHAGNRVPKALSDLGLEKNDLKKHIGWDIGAEDAARHLSRALDMPAVMAIYSRLVTDLNRAPEYHECMPEASDLIEIPRNKNLTREEKTLRLREIYWPYQKQIGRITDRLIKRGPMPVLISVHSFTPSLQGQRRPWHISLLWNKEDKIGKKIVSALRKNHPDLLVGENEPYSLSDERFPGSTICRHAEERNLPYIFVEFRQDLIDTKAKAAVWAEIFLHALKPALASPEIYLDRKIRALKK